MSIIKEVKEHQASVVRAELVTLRAIMEAIMLSDNRKALDILVKLIDIKETYLK